MGSIPKINNTYNNKTHKYNVTVFHIPIVFASSTQLPLDKLDDFVNKELTEIAANNPHIHELLTIISQSASNLNNLPSELLNSSFTELLQHIIPLITKFEESQQNTASLIFEATQNNNETNTLLSQPTNNDFPYVFKQPKKDTVFEKHWRLHFKELEDFKNTFGHCNVSRTTRGYDQLGNWLSDQRRKLRRGKMTKLQYEMLSQLGKISHSKELTFFKEWNGTAQIIL